ncbi:MAG TPA: DUF2892 domain-containing protein [Epsilonproteobacteria bacterium]|mgnify:CR=1 FL=1|nr:DUF2892 domain-containing protein [Campylobacterota bacterium]
MTCNVGKTDRMIRIIIGVILLIIAILQGSLLLGIISLVPLATGIFKMCLLYTILKINTGC